MAAPPTTLSPADERRLQRDWRFFIWLTFLFGFGFAVYNGIFQNFIHDALRATPLDLGIMESSQRVPGLAGGLAHGHAGAVAESRIAGLGLGIAACGIGASGLMHTKPSLIVIGVFWSIGFHVYSTVSNAITLALCKGTDGGLHLGKMSAVSAISTIVGLGTAFGVKWALPGLPYSAYFLFAGATIMVGAVLCSRLSTHAEGGPRQRIVWRREYRLYYLLTFLDGCRRQVFNTFASYVLIFVYHEGLAAMLAVQFIYSVSTAIVAPRIGRLVDRIGERKPLMFYAVAVGIVFIGYATFRSIGMLFALFVTDNVLFTFGVGFTTYLHRIVRPSELTPSLAMGTTMNHVAAVVIPVSGALLWQATGNYQWPFIVGALISALSFGSMLRLPAGPAPARQG